MRNLFKLNLGVKSIKMVKFSSILNGVVSVCAAILLISCLVSAAPSGASTTFIQTGSAPNDSAMSLPAVAGNVTEVNLYGYSTTRSWQGFYGNVSGTIQLADAGDNVFYNWSDVSPKGQVYISTNNSIQWAYTECFNYTATGTYASDVGQAGSTSLYGTNLTQLETQYGISVDDVDGVNETFNLYGGGTHNSFFVGNLQFDNGECRSTRIFSSAGVGEDNKFEEVLLYEPQSASVIFSTLLNSDVLGFDGRSHDFESIVLENGHGTDTSSTTYYFYLELQ